MIWAVLGSTMFPYCSRTIAERRMVQIDIDVLQIALISPFKRPGLPVSD